MPGPLTSRLDTSQIPNSSNPIPHFRPTIFSRIYSKHVYKQFFPFDFDYVL